MKRWLLLCALLPAAAGAQQLTDFAYAAPITAVPGASFQRVELSPAVYQALTRADLGDLRVFNAAGEVVPHAIEPRELAPAQQSRPLVAPLFAIPAPDAAAQPLHLRVETRADGAVVSVAPSNAGAVAAPQAWLVDLSQFKQRLHALELTPADAARQFSGRMRVEASDDLTQWRTLADGAAVLRLGTQDQALARLRIEWPATQAKYLRLSWVDRQAAAHRDVAFAAVQVEPAPAALEPARSWLRVELTQRRTQRREAAGRSEFVYGVPGAAPIDRLRIHLPQPNSVVPVEALTRAKPDDAWRVIGRDVAYRLEQDGSEAVNPDLVVRLARELMLRFDARGGGVGSDGPRVEVGWVPHALVFAARGNAPFQLGFGDARQQAAALPVASLVPGYEQDEAARKRIASAQLGAPATAGGAARLAAPTDFKRWLLWAVLLTAVALLGAMAWKLWRQIGATAPKDSSAS